MVSLNIKHHPQHTHTLVVGVGFRCRKRLLVQITSAHCTTFSLAINSTGSNGNTTGVVMRAVNRQWCLDTTLQE